MQENGDDDDTRDDSGVRDDNKIRDDVDIHTLYAPSSWIIIFYAIHMI